MWWWMKRKAAVPYGRLAGLDHKVSPTHLWDQISNQGRKILSWNSVKFLETESHLTLLSPKPKSLGSPGKKKLPKNVPPSLKTISESTPPKPDVNQGSYLSLWLPTLTWKRRVWASSFKCCYWCFAYIPTFGTITRQGVGDVSKDFSKPQMILQRRETEPR